MSDAFRDLFLPNGQAPLSGLLTRRLDLAAILDSVAVKGISDFYGGNLTQEMAAAVRKILEYISTHEFCIVLRSQSEFYHFKTIFLLYFLALLCTSKGPLCFNFIREKLKFLRHTQLN